MPTRCLVRWIVLAWLAASCAGTEVPASTAAGGAAPPPATGETTGGATSPVAAPATAPAPAASRAPTTASTGGPTMASLGLPPKTKEEALALAKLHLATISAPAELVVDEARATEHVFGWVFPSTSARYLETRDVGDLVPGLGPIAVLRDATIVQLPSSVTPAKTIADLERRWKESHP